MSHKQLLAIALLIAVALTVPPSILLLVLLHDVARVRKKLLAIVTKLGLEVP